MEYGHSFTEIVSFSKSSFMIILAKKLPRAIIAGQIETDKRETASETAHRSKAERAVTQTASCSFSFTVTLIYFSSPTNFIFAHK